MKKILLMLILITGSVFIFSGCDDDVYVVRPDYTPPSVPKGIYSITADEAVHLFWEENDESDFKEYRVYRRVEGDDYYYRIAIAKIAEYVDWDVKNGTTYFYAVTARDRHGNESDFSDVAYDTPRPEGFGRIIQDYHQYPNTSGYDFSRDRVLHYDNKDADIYLDYDDYYGVYFLCVRDNSTDIQDFGYTEELDDVNVAPDHGWSQVGWVEVILGHSYIIWTRDNHYAKLRVVGFTRSYGVIFDWAYQVDPGNPELAPRPPHAENYLRVAMTQTKDR